jgi:magnesium transporter
MLEAEFGFHQLALEDVRRGHQRAKIDEYDDYYFAVLYSVSYAPPTTKLESGLTAVEVGAFFGANYVVTVHKRPVRELEEAIHRWEKNPDIVQDHNIGFLVHMICDIVVDEYFVAADAMGSVIDDLEERIFVNSNREILADIFAFRKDLLSMRKLVGPAREVFNTLSRRDLPLFDTRTAVYFSDVYDHIIRVADTIDTYRDLISGALDGYLTIVSNNLNEIVKVLTASSIILMSVTFIAGVYGMNFANMPELGWSFGYPGAILLMVAVALTLFLVFRRKSWL